MTRAERRRRIIDTLRKTPPEALAPPDTYDPREVAAMLREIGIALVEVSQPTPIVESRLEQIARRYTTRPVRVVAKGSPRCRESWWPKKSKSTQRSSVRPSGQPNSPP